MRSFTIFLALLVSAPSFPLMGKAESGSLEGVVTISETRGGAVTQTLYTRKGNELRIENIDKSKPEPINVVDLNAKKLTITYPHTSSFVVVDLTKSSTPPGAPNLPPGVPAPPPMPSLNASVDSATSPPLGFPTPPPVPSRPPMPNNPMPFGVNGMPSMPMMPPTPPMGMMMGAKSELKKTEQTKKIQGYDCSLYTVSDRMETMEIWATPDTALFPFRLVQTNYRSRHFGPVMLEERWIELLRSQSLFPLEATLRNDLPAAPASSPRAGQQNSVPEADHGGERYSFKVDKIEKKKIDNPEELFSPPKNYYEIPGQ